MRKKVEELNKRIAVLDGIPLNERVPKKEWNQQYKKFKAELFTWESNMSAQKIIGDFKVIPSLATVTIKTHDNTQYDIYMQILDQIMQGLNELRNNLSIKKFGIPFNKLNDDANDTENNDIDKIKAIRQVYPKRISKELEKE